MDPTPPLGEDLLVAEATADTVVSPTGTASTVRVDLRGTPVHGLRAADPPVQVLGAVFSAPQLAQVLVNALRKVVRSGRQHQHVYASPKGLVLRSEHPARNRLIP